jgi:pimeloyl-ACP methyl ester carboxylesterase
VLLVGGDASPPRFRATLDGLRHCMPLAQRESILGAGHRFPATHAREFHEILTRFIAALPR